MDIIKSFQEIRKAYQDICSTSKIGKENIKQLESRFTELLEEPVNFGKITDKQIIDSIMPKIFFLLLFSHLEECLQYLYFKHKDEFTKEKKDSAMYGFNSYKSFIKWLYRKKSTKDNDKEFNDVISWLIHFSYIRNIILHAGGNIVFAKNTKKIEEIVKKFKTKFKNFHSIDIKNNKIVIYQEGMDIFCIYCLKLMVLIGENMPNNALKLTAISLALIAAA